MTAEFIRALCSQSLEIDCSKIVLRQDKAEQPRTLEGPGLLSQGDDGAFQLRMYPQNLSMPDAFKLFFGGSGVIQPGVILPAESFYRLDATDFAGHPWSSPRVRLQVSAGVSGTVIHAKVDALNLSTQLQKSSGHGLRLIFPEELNLAWNRTTEDSLKSGERTLRESHERTRAEFQVGTLAIEIQKSVRSDATTTVHVRSADPLPGAIEWRVQEALRFLTFREASWTIAEVVADRELRVQVLPPVQSRSGLLSPPLATTDSNEDYWKLFGAYLEHVCRNTTPNSYHPLTARLNTVIDSRHKQLEILGLLLGVAVEGVLSTEFPELAKPTAGFRSALDAVKKLARRMRCDDSRLRVRIEGSLGTMYSARTKDKLIFLKGRGVISDTVYDAWDELRNSTAHAVHLDSMALQTHLTRCYQVHELLLILAFLAIGYQGRYRKYSEPGWPIAQFQFSLDQLSVGRPEP